MARHSVQPQNLFPLLERFSYIQSLRTDYACADLTAAEGMQLALDRFIDSTGVLAQERVLMDWILAIPLHHGLSICALAHGDHELARNEATLLCTLAAEPGERTYMALGHNTLAQIALAEDDLRSADRELQCALDLLKQVDAPLAAWRVHDSVAVL